MLKFQEQCRDDLNDYFKRRGIIPAYEIVECKKDSTLSHEKGDVYLRYQLRSNDQSYDVYIYTDEAGVNINGRWFAFELPDYSNNVTRLKQNFIKFVCTSIEDGKPDEAYSNIQKTI